MRALARTPALSRCLFGAALALAALAGCDAREDAAAEWVRAASQDSAAAERAMGSGDVARAQARLEALAARPVPDGVARSDARVVRQDAHERLARIALAAGDLARATRHVELGLGLGEETDVLTASLLTTRGRVREAEGRDREAAADYHRALVISEALLDRALGETDEP